MLHILIFINKMQIDILNESHNRKRPDQSRYYIKPKNPINRLSREGIWHKGIMHEILAPEKHERASCRDPDV